MKNVTNVTDVTFSNYSRTCIYHFIVFGGKTDQKWSKHSSLPCLQLLDTILRNEFSFLGIDILANEILFLIVNIIHENEILFLRMDVIHANVIVFVRIVIFSQRNSIFENEYDLCE